jgi:hypothetical protein
VNFWHIAELPWGIRFRLSEREISALGAEKLFACPERRLFVFEPFGGGKNGLLLTFPEVCLSILRVEGLGFDRTATSLSAELAYHQTRIIYQNVNWTLNGGYCA